MRNRFAAFGLAVLGHISDGDVDLQGKFGNIENASIPALTRGERCRTMGGNLSCFLPDHVQAPSRPITPS